MNNIAQLRRMNIGSGFRAYTLRGDKKAAQIDPFLSVDHAWMGAPTFSPHPHSGFSAVSYLFLDSETAIRNRDSLGANHLIQPGGLHWTAAGSGVIHEELPAEIDKTVHMLQIFVNLPVEKQSEKAFALSLEPQDIPVVQRPGVKIRIPLGHFDGIASPMLPPTEVRLLDLSLDAGSALSIPLAAGDNAFILPIFGSVEIDGQDFDAGELGVPTYLAETESREIRLRATHGNTKLVLFSGRPLQQAVHTQGSMSAASAEALNSRIAAYRRGEFGSL